ncbi:thiamine pyrophosphate-dependent enzyme [Bdellovibrio sp. ArHS]|uniref:thiamine pyrophosphate-dependent enzyme n=1 Tax=Bdellovibrio sp. ArHS TaxID=1569284 RepID=UPI000B0F32F4|nr:thiamine pyrophosphate-dependent enzyme [Bdellovibrio sp. ArHS]
MQTTPLTKNDYKGSPSTLCTGCGHDLISTQISNACFQLGIHPFDVAKISGIGCSSKLPAYFMSQSFAFNSMHGRMAPVATGAKLANPQLKILGISGDGDTASIGIGGFIHLIKRNVPMVYIVANNGVYGLTKGQFSPTADPHSPRKTGEIFLHDTLDLCTLSLELGCGFVARSFVGNPAQFAKVLQKAFEHPGTALIDVLSPCITFNNHNESTKSYPYLKAHEVPMAETAPFADPLQAIAAIRESYRKGEILTGLFYSQPEGPTLPEKLHSPARPLSEMGVDNLRPNQQKFEMMMEEYLA